MMRRYATTWLLSLALYAICALAGCARGAAELVDGFTDAGGNGADSGAGKDDAMAALDSGAIKDAGKPSGKDSGMAGKDAGGGGGTDAGPMVSCATLNMCSSARSMSAVAGDTGSDIAMTTGVRSEWLSVHVSDTGGTGSEIKARVTLTSSGDANYDLIVHQPTPDGGKAEPPSDCNATPVSSMNATGVDTVSHAWNDDQNFLGQTAGDGLILSIEVRHVSGPCGTWSLTVEGNK